MQQKKSSEIILFVIGCVLINCIGKTIAEQFVLPVWLDSVGTVLMAYAMGPVCGTMVGVCGNILYYIFFGTSMLYGFTSVAIGVTVGVCGKKGMMNHIFGVLTTAFLTTLFSVFISVPINYVMTDGVVGNVWGSGVSKFLQELGVNRALSNIIGQFYLDFLDKVITILLLYAIIHIVRKKRSQGFKWKNRGKLIKTMTFLLVSSFAFSTCPVYAEDKAGDTKTDDSRYNTYTQTVYDGENGLSGGMANDIAQTMDGVLWIGTYNGLYRYTGNTFQWMNDLKSVKTVNCLYTDASGRMWIGTNDNGISIYTNQNIVNVVNRDNGLPSDSVRCITESADGYYYVGTTGSMAILKLVNGLEVCETVPEITFANSVCADQKGNIATVTDEGELYLLRDKEIITKRRKEGNGEFYRCCAFDKEGRLYVGTSESRVDVYQIEEKELKKISSVTCGDLGMINSFSFSDREELFICADNGIGCLDGKNKFFSIHTNSFQQSVERMLVDYQGNLWFTSSRRGLLRLCPSVFTEVYSVEDSVVNTVTKWQGCVYVGLDNGLDVLDKEQMTKMSKRLIKEFEGVRIRSLHVDSRNSLWVCTSGMGITEITAAGKLKHYDSKAGAAGDKCRTIIEREDGTIVAAGDYGVTYIKDGKVTGAIGAEDGLNNPKVLALMEREDGSILAGTDGNGIAIIQDGKVKGYLKKENGLSSDIVLRLVPESNGEGIYIVSGNGLCYMDKNEEIRTLDNFPHYNNYDLVEGKNGKVFVFGSAGIYVVDKRELLDGEEVRYELLNVKKGMRIDLTPNAWNYMDEKDNLYLSGKTGVISLNLNQYSISMRSYRMLLKTIKVDGKTFFIEKGETITIPRDADKIEMIPEIVNYSVNDTNVSVYLEGVDKEPRIMPLTELNTIVYSGIPSGKYTFRISILDYETDVIMAGDTYSIVKEKEMYDNWWFRFYMVIVAAIFVSYITWLFFRTQIQKTLRLQKLEIEQAKKQIQMGNETILTIAKTVDAKDENTSQHSSRVSEYSVLIAKQLGYSIEECERLRQMALLHDIGKIGIPDRILNKPAKLTDEEYEVMKTHVTRGAEILKNFTLIENVEEGVLYHHERYDGQGYVHGMKGEEIPLNARIIGIADAFDAMTANRVYRKKLNMEYVLEELRKGRGTQFDPQLVDIMLKLVEDKAIVVE